MDVLLYVLGALTLLAGIAGVVLPALPGAPLLFVGALLVAWADGFARMGWPSLVVVGLLSALVFAVDHVASLLGARAFGASGWAVAGGAIGLVVGLFFGLPGLILGPAAGAVIAEYLKNADAQRAARAGVGVLIGFLVGGAVKVALAFVIVGVVLFALVV